jgi:hypothetical protein
MDLNNLGSPAIITSELFFSQYSHAGNTLMILAAAPIASASGKTRNAVDDDCPR